MRCSKAARCLAIKSPASAAASSGGQIRRRRETKQPNTVRHAYFVEMHDAFIEKASRLRGARAITNREMRKDQARARQMAGRTYHFGRLPAVRLHDAHRVEGILNRILRLRFHDDGAFGNTPPFGEMRHDSGFHL